MNSATEPSSSSDSPSEIPRFSVGDDVFCDYKSTWYAAKILKVIQDGHGVRYHIHYKKWGHKYDTTLPSSKVKLPGEFPKEQSYEYRVNRNNKQKLEEQMPAIEIDSPSADEYTDSEVLEQEETPLRSFGNLDFHPPSQTEPVEISISEDLYVQFSKGIEMNRKQSRLLKLPQYPTVQDILNDYHLQCAGHDANDQVLKHAIIEYIKADFSIILSNQLITDPEIPQYSLVNKLLVSRGSIFPMKLPTSQQSSETTNPSLMPADSLTEIYGATHLLRYIVYYSYLADSTHDFQHPCKSDIAKALSDILELMQKHVPEYFHEEWLPDKEALQQLEDQLPKEDAGDKTEK